MSEAECVCSFICSTDVSIRGKGRMLLFVVFVYLNSV